MYEMCRSANIEKETRNGLLFNISVSFTLFLACALGYF